MAADALAAVFWALVTVYALTGGADFGGGMWDLLAGGSVTGAPVREHIDRSIAPVWEANHVWLVIDLVVLWTGFPAAFGAVMSTLFVPLSLAALGIVLRGAGFAFRQPARTLRWQRVSGATFALASLLTPFFLGASAGAVATGRVAASGSTDRLGSWTSPTCVVAGLLSVAAFAYLASVYLTADARRRAPHLVGYFRVRSVASGAVVGVLAGVCLWLLTSSAPRTQTRLTSGPGLAFLVVSLVLGVVVLAVIALGKDWEVRPLAAGAFTALIWGWGISQWPLMLPPDLTVRAAAAPPSTPAAELVIVAFVVLLVAPSFYLLFHLAQRELLAEQEDHPPGAPRPDPATDGTGRSRRDKFP